MPTWIYRGSQLGLWSLVGFGVLGSLSSCSAEAVLPTAEAHEVALEVAPWPVVRGPEAQESLRLFVLGDTGEGVDRRRSRLPRTLAAMEAQEPPTALILLGDNAYPCGLESVEDPRWRSVVDPLLTFGVPVFPILGNHDYGSRTRPRCSFSAPQAQVRQSGRPAYERWVFPALNYVVGTPLVEIFFLDSTPLAYGWEAQAKESIAGLKAALAKPRVAPWRILAAHHPPYSCGMHGDQSKTEAFREAVEPFLSQVDLILAGHDHNLELRLATGQTPPILISGGGSKLRKSISCESEGLRLKTGFAVVEVTAAALQVEVFCNGEAAPCLSHLWSR